VKQNKNNEKDRSRFIWLNCCGLFLFISLSGCAVPRVSSPPEDGITMNFYKPGPGMLLDDNNTNNKINFDTFKFNDDDY